MITSPYDQHRALRSCLKTLHFTLHKDISQKGFEPGHPCPIARDARYCAENFAFRLTQRYIADGVWALSSMSYCTRCAILRWKLCASPYTKIYCRRGLSPIIHVLLRAMRDIAPNYRDGGLGSSAHPIYFWFIT